MHYKTFVIAITLLAVASLTHAQNCYQSSILSPAPFMGNNDEIFKLADGSVWQVKYEYQYFYEYYPEIVICPSKGKLVVKGKTLNVVQIASSQTKPASTSATASPTGDVIESNIEGEFKGWDGETIFKLTNGQIWQQASYAYVYSYKYRPSVMIYPTGGGYSMQVEDMDSKISVVRLK